MVREMQHNFFFYGFWILRYRSSRDMSESLKYADNLFIGGYGISYEKF